MYREPIHARDYRRRDRFYEEPEEQELMPPPPRFYQHQPPQPPPYWPYQQQALPPPPVPAPVVPPAGESKDDRIHRLEREIMESRQAIREMSFEARHQAERMLQQMQDMRDTLREEQRRSAEATQQAHQAQVHAQAQAAAPVSPAMHPPPPMAVPDGFIVMFDENSPTGYVTIARESLEAFYAARRSAPAAAAPTKEPPARAQAHAPTFVAGPPDYPSPPPAYQAPPAYQPYPPQYQQQPYPPQYQQHQPPPQYQQQQPPPQYQQHQPPPQYQQPQAGAQAEQQPTHFQQPQPTWGQQPQAQPPAAAAPAPQAHAATPIDDPVEAAIQSYNASKKTLSRLRTAFGNDEDDDSGKDSGEAATAALSPEATAAVVAKPEMFYDTGVWKFPVDKDGKPLTGFKDGLSTIGANLDKLPAIGAMFLDGAQKMLDIVDRRSAKFREENELLEKRARLQQAMQQLPPKQQQQQAPAPAPAPKAASFSGFPAVDEIPRPPRNN